MLKKLFWIAAAALLMGGCIGPAPIPTPTETATVETPAIPTPSPTPETSPVPVITATPTVSPTPLSAPAVLDRYPLPPGDLGETLTSGAGKVWAGTTFGTVDEFDAASGEVRKVYSLVSGSPDKPSPVKAMAFDGQNLWVVVASGNETGLATQLFVVDPASGTVLQQIDLSDQQPDHLGLAPGQVWSQNQVYDSASQQSTEVPMNTFSTVFAYDGTGWMWTGGAVACDLCPTNLYRIQTNDPSTAAEPGPKASEQVNGLALAGQRMWAITGFNHLDGYHLTAGLDTQPSASLDLSGEMENPPDALVYDDHSLWLLASSGQGGGYIYQHDPLSGAKIDALQVGESEGTSSGQARIPMALSFDGRDLWVLTSYDLVRVGLPWTRQH